MSKVRNGGDRIGLALRFGLANDEATVTRTPGREHVEGGGGGGPVKRGFHRLAIQGDEGSLGELGDCPGPGEEARLKALGMEAGKRPAAGIVRGNPRR